MTVDPLTCVATIPAQTKSLIFLFLHSQNVEKLFVYLGVLLLRLGIILVFLLYQGCTYLGFTNKRLWLLTFVLNRNVAV